MERFYPVWLEIGPSVALLWACPRALQPPPIAGTGQAVFNTVNPSPLQRLILATIIRSYDGQFYCYTAKVRQRRMVGDAPDDKVISWANSYANNGVSAKDSPLVRSVINQCKALNYLEDDGSVRWPLAQHVEGASMATLMAIASGADLAAEIGQQQRNRLRTDAAEIGRALTVYRASQSERQVVHEALQTLGVIIQTKHLEPWQVDPVLQRYGLKRSAQPGPIADSYGILINESFGTSAASVGKAIDEIYALKTLSWLHSKRYTETAPAVVNQPAKLPANQRLIILDEDAV